MFLPMLEKRVDAKVGMYFLFGEDPKTKLVDISNGTDDVFTGLPVDVAIKVIEAHDKFREELYSILCKSQVEEIK